jgi:hypothetical protein
MRHIFPAYVLAHLCIGKRRAAVYAPLRSEATVGFDDHSSWNAGFALEAVDVLGEEL